MIYKVTMNEWVHFKQIIKVCKNKYFLLLKD
jgi:hypothetical protein